MDPPTTNTVTRKDTGSITKPAIPKKPTLVIPKRTPPLPPKQTDNSEQNQHVVNIPSARDDEKSNSNSTRSESVILINSPISTNIITTSGSVSEKRAAPKIPPRVHPKPRPKSLPKNLESSSPFGRPVNHDEILKDLVFTPQERLQKQKSLTNLDTQFEKFFARNSTIATESSKIYKEGILTKQGHRIKNWKQRYFVLEGFFLKYYKKKRVKVIHRV